jgi:hypothetical protein
MKGTFLISDLILEPPDFAITVSQGLSQGTLLSLNKVCFNHNKNPSTTDKHEIFDAAK